jgi:tRNA threonylcarbamoyladenosine modification (KEOPS) complex  Pcc1 subunit
MVKQNLNLKLTLAKRHGIDYAKIIGKGKKHSRSSMLVREKGDMLIVEINSGDITALRASANSLLRDIQVINSIE